MKPKKKNKFRKTILWITSILVVSLLALFLGLQLTYVQTSLARYASKILSEKTGFSIDFTEVQISWFDRLSLKNLTIKDEADNLLLNINDLKVDYKLADLYHDKFNLDQVWLTGLNMSLNYAQSDTLNITRLINRISKLFSTGGQSKTGIFTIDKILISDSHFEYDVGNERLPTGLFDAKYFVFDQINANLQSFEIAGDSISFEANSLRTIEENSGLEIHNLSTFFLISSRTMRLITLNADIGTSKISDQLIFDYDNYSSLSNFIDSVTIQANFIDTEVASKDLAHFAPYFNQINDKYLLSGNFTGEISDFKIKNLSLKFGRRSALTGDLYFSGLPSINETFIDLKFTKSSLTERDVIQYVPSENFKEYNRFNQISVDGSFTGYIEDFVAYGKFSTEYGTITSDINLKLSDDKKKSAYSGKIKLTNFDVGSYAEQPKLGKVSLNGRISGSGLELSTADFLFDGTIESLYLNGYEFTGIKTSGKFKQQYFSGLLDINDPNLVLHTINEIDLRDGARKISIKGDLVKVHLDSIKLYPEHAFIRTKIQADLDGFDIDSVKGYVLLEDFYAEHNDQNISAEHLTINSKIENNSRSLEFISEKANVIFSGSFSFRSAYRDIHYMAQEYLMSLKNDKDSLALFYSESPPSGPDDAYAINAQVKLSNIDHFLRLFYPYLSLHNNTTIGLQFRHDKTSTLAIQMENDSLTFNENTFVNNVINIDASKFIGTPEILASADIQSDYQQLNNGALLENLIVTAVWDNKKIDFNWFHEQKDISNVNDIYGDVRFFRDSTKIHLNRSNISLLGDTWTIQDNNAIIITPNLIQVSDLNVYSRNQMLSISGEIADDPDKILAITANNLEIGVINSLISKNLSGRLSGEFAISNTYHSPTIVSNFYIDAFAINQVLVGNIYSSNDWNNTNKLFDIQFIVSRDDIPAILVNGIFDPFHPKKALNLEASFINSRLDILQPFIETLFTDIHGTISGKAHITGPLYAPRISGLGTFDQAGLKVNYLNTYYEVAGGWAFDSTAIYLKNLNLKDIKGNSAVLDGLFTHKGFKNFYIDLKGSMNNFMVLNTTAKDNDLFYGTALGTGNISFTGPIEDITIKVNASTAKGTRFYVPLGGSSSSEFEEYITFIDFKDTLHNQLQTGEEKVTATGLNMEFDIDITEDAYAEIIFDITSGDIIRGRGDGHLSITINNEGEFNMLGTYEFVEGGYNFTMYNIVNKEFTINPKSRITWSGDPYNGIMDINASYKLSTSLAPLIDSIYRDQPEVRRIYPTEVSLALNGPLLSPDIKFNILINDYPKSNVDMDTQIKGFLNTIANDQQELNRQVFSLLILRNFSEPNSFSSSGTIGSSVSEFVSNQLSYWISQVDENLTIDMDLGELDANALKTFQLRISYAFLEGKLIVTRDGGFTDANNEASVSSIAGDWTLEYLLSKDGKLRVKLFNKTNYNQLNSTTGSASQSLISAGFSLIFTTSFDDLSELFTRPKEKSKPQNIEPTSSGMKPDELLLDSPAGLKKK